MTKIKVLMVTYMPWRADNSTGNTFSNIFSGMTDRLEFRQIYIKGMPPDNQLVDGYFLIDEKKLLKSIVTGKGAGQVVRAEDFTPGGNTHYEAAYDKMRQMRWEMMLLAQDCIGRLGRWRTRQLDKYVEDYAPDVIFGALGRSPVVNNIMTYLHTRHGIPMIAFPWDDHYSLKKVSLSPFYWIRIFGERGPIRKCARSCNMLYTITDEMKTEYSRVFGKTCKTLYKGYRFETRPAYRLRSDVIKIVYMGNIGAGREEELVKVARAIANINRQKKQFLLNIYTKSPLSRSMARKLNIPEVSEIKRPVPNDRVMPTMLDADILLHVEPTQLKERLYFRLSFSTKLVDYFYAGRCILACGGNTAAMNYLRRNDAAIVQDRHPVEDILRGISARRGLLDEYAEKSWNCGKRNHDISRIQQMVYHDFANAAGKTV